MNTRWDARLRSIGLLYHYGIVWSGNELRLRVERILRIP